MKYLPLDVKQQSINQSISAAYIGGNPYWIFMPPFCERLRLDKNVRKRFSLYYVPLEGGRDIEIVRPVLPPAGRKPNEGTSFSSIEMYKYSNSSSQGCAGERIGTRYLRP